MELDRGHARGQVQRADANRPAVGVETLQRLLGDTATRRASGRLDRFQSVFDHPPAPPLAQELEVLRGLGRDGFPAPAMWNALFAGIAAPRPSVEPLLPKVSRAPALLAACGLDPHPMQRKPVARVVTDPDTGLRRIAPAATKEPIRALPSN